LCFKPERPTHNSDDEDDISSKKPKRIDANVSKSDLSWHYGVSELREFLKETQLISTGKKTQLVNRILEYFADKDAAFLKYNPEERKKEKDRKRQEKADRRNPGELTAIRDKKKKKSDESFDDIEEIPPENKKTDSSEEENSGSKRKSNTSRKNVDEAAEKLSKMTLKKKKQQET